MVVDYPGLRRRAPRGVEVAPIPEPHARQTRTNQDRRWKASKVYFALSILVALVAVFQGGDYSKVPPSFWLEPVGWRKWFLPLVPVPPPPPPPPEPKAPAWIRWILPQSNKEDDPETPVVPPPTSIWHLDPLFLYPHPQPFLTELIDKILTSTPRLLAMANFLLSITYLVHTAIANLFLDLPSLSRESWAGRERLGGFLVFKLLLISAVVAPDTLDLLILLTWYTMLSFLRSLAGLAAATTAHTSQSGQPPRRGVLSLLMLVLLSDILAAASCVALFHGAGWSMVVLLTCDCALLGVDVLSHILRHVSQRLDLAHASHIAQLEARQLALHNNLHRWNRAGTSQVTETVPETITETPALTEEQVMDESRNLDQRMERLESQHNRRLHILETAVFVLQLMAYSLTIAHFLHIWSLHGLQFTLIDGVLALHLHSALSAAGKKIAERRNLNRIARDLDAMFEDATEVELAKSSPDVFCCICLGTMSTGSVKKVKCGHFYHTHCLREVVERARSMEAAKCPLCRASLLNGEPPERTADDDAPVAAGGEHALFRFSTEGILPAWLPLPAFSFEVVRRPAADNNNNNNNTPAAATGNATAPAEATNGGQNPAPAAAPAAARAQPQTSFFRRLLILAGVVPMSLEEEAAALEQLVDMFPQYERADLLSELRARGSAEGVVESVFQGAFAGVARGQQAGENNQAASPSEDAPISLPRVEAR